MNFEPNWARKTNILYLYFGTKLYYIWTHVYSGEFAKKRNASVEMKNIANESAIIYSRSSMLYLFIDEWTKVFLGQHH